MRINLKRWKRRDHFLLFRKYKHPFFSVCVDVDVTPLWHASRSPSHPSFFLASLYLMLKAANDTEAFRLRLRKRGVDDSIPRVVFGKCMTDQQLVRMPVAIEVHHALVDGVDVAKFIERFQAALTTFEVKG
jgi:chloramphenicol O-acetyltransferase